MRSARAVSSRLMSRYRYLSRTSSLTSAGPSMGNGSGSASLSTSTSSAATSTSPVASSGFSLPGRALPHAAGHQHAELGPQLVAQGFLAAPHDLYHAAGVPQVDEHHATVVPPPRHPAGQHHALSCVRRPQRPRLMGPDIALFPFSWSGPYFCSGRSVPPAPGGHRLRAGHSPSVGPDGGVRPARNGLLRRSAPMVVAGPCPDSTSVSSGKVRQTLARLRRIVW